MTLGDKNIWQHAVTLKKLEKGSAPAPETVQKKFNWRRVASTFQGTATLVASPVSFCHEASKPLEVSGDFGVSRALERKLGLNGLGGSRKQYLIFARRPCYSVL